MSAVSRAMDRVLEGRATTRLQTQVGELRLVVFSDHHRGKMDAADDFAGAVVNYRTALAHYLGDGFGLVLLGDVEELWECEARESFEAHRSCLDLEHRFAARERLYRIFGNHDDQWTAPMALHRELGRWGIEAPEFRVSEGLLLDVLGPDPLGRILLVHGHQGTAFSDQFRFVSRFFVRHVWRPLQRRTHVRTSSLSETYDLRRRHEVELSRWAREKEQLLLVTGHTHHPVFAGEARETYVARRVEELAEEVPEIEDRFVKDDAEVRLQHLRAELRYREELMHGHALRREDSNEAYFNSGCCSYRSGSITGIELADEEIRLVRWRDEGGMPRRQVLRRRPLRALFGALGSPDGRDVRT